MQKVLLSVARRVCAVPSERPRPDLMQSYEVNVRVRESSADESALASLSALMLEEGDASEEAEVPRPSRRRLDPPPQLIMSEVRGKKDTRCGLLMFDDSIAQFACRLRFSRNTNCGTCIAQVPTFN